MTGNGADRTILAVDLGTQSLRVFALCTDGRRLWSWSAPVESDVDGARFEQAPEQWARLLADALAEAGRAGIRPDAVAAAGPLAGYVALDADGAPLTPAAMYTDRRSLPDVARVEQVFGGDAPFRPVISDPWPHWLRLCREQPGIAARTRHFLDATGWLNFCLTGLATLNAYTALRLGPANAVSRLGLGQPEMARFGRVVPVGSRIGMLAGAAARHFGGAEIPVVAAAFDSKCAYLGSGLAQPGEALDISGTVTSFGLVAERSVDDALRRIYTVPFGENWLVRGSTAAAGSSLEWARAQLLHADFAPLYEAAAAVAPAAGGMTYFP
jgi:xylulokinase